MAELNYGIVMGEAGKAKRWIDVISCFGFWETKAKHYKLMIMGKRGPGSMLNWRDNGLTYVDFNIIIFLFISAWPLFVWSLVILKFNFMFSCQTSLQSIHTLLHAAGQTTLYTMVVFYHSPETSPALHRWSSCGCILLYRHHLNFGS